jgi:hypothetical protein
MPIDDTVTAKRQLIVQIRRYIYTNFTVLTQLDILARSQSICCCQMHECATETCDV